MLPPFPFKSSWYLLGVYVRSNVPHRSTVRPWNHDVYKDAASGIHMTCFCRKHLKFLWYLHRYTSLDLYIYIDLLDLQDARVIWVRKEVI